MKRSPVILNRISRSYPLSLSHVIQQTIPQPPANLVPIIDHQTLIKEQLEIPCIQRIADFLSKFQDFHRLPFTPFASPLQSLFYPPGSVEYDKGLRPRARRAQRARVFVAWKEGGLRNLNNSRMTLTPVRPRTDLQPAITITMQRRVLRVRQVAHRVLHTLDRSHPLRV